MRRHSRHVPPVSASDAVPYAYHKTGPNGCRRMPCASVASVASDAVIQCRWTADHANAHDSDGPEPCEAMCNDDHTDDQADDSTDAHDNDGDDASKRISST